MNDSVQYPDVLGALTGGARVNMGVMQFALAVNPAIIPAGRSSEAILLAQNASDHKVEVAALLRLPDQDARRQKGRFLSRSARVVVEVQPGEVGYVSLPFALLPDTALGDQYKLSVDIEVRSVTNGKPARVRAQDSGGMTFQPDTISGEAREHFQTLQRLEFSTHKPALRNALDTTFAVSEARLAPPPNLKAQWVSLWTIADADERLLMLRYADLLTVRVLPQLRRQKIYAALQEATKTHFADAGYRLYDGESALIAKMMTLILEYAAPQDSAHGFLAAGKYAIAPLFQRLLRDPNHEIDLPHWFSAFLHLLGQDDRVAEYATRIVPRTLYLPLLQDAVEHAFALVQQASGQSLGQQSEIASYAQQMVNVLELKEGLNFQRVYLPLVMGGILINDKIILPGEKQDDQVSKLVNDLDERRAEMSPDDSDVLELTQQIIHRVTKIYGHRGE
ncbi:MAG: hypothetical protein IT320_14450 [Anaerolineae bacterium]|nr:hypothetical protein [Anaerolineae bacterium]